MNNIYDILETCLQGLEHGSGLETLLARYPEQADELRPILETAIRARTRVMPAPSDEMVHRGRTRFMQHAAELREQRIAPIVSRKRVIPIFQRLAISLALTSAFLVSGTGLVSASSTALPGENLYPVKRSWEDLRLFFTFDDHKRVLLENEFETERLEEVSDLVTVGRAATIQFSGVYMVVNGKTYISGIQVMIVDQTHLPDQPLQNGAAVSITGHTNSSGYVEVEQIQLLPDGSAVPVGNPLKGESDSGSEDGSTSSSSGSGSGSQGEMPASNSGAEGESGSPSFHLDGTVESVSGNSIVVDGHTSVTDGAQISGDLKPGMTVEMEGYFSQQGDFIVTNIKVKESGSSGGNEGSSGSGSSGSGASNSGGGGGSGSGGSGGDDHGGGGGGGGGGGDD